MFIKQGIPVVFEYAINTTYKKQVLKNFINNLLLLLIINKVVSIIVFLSFINGGHTLNHKVCNFRTTCPKMSLYSSKHLADTL